jgi:hypothetical protein
VTFSPIDWFIVSAYLIFSVAIGMIGRRYVGSVSHYLVAGRVGSLYRDSHASGHRDRHYHLHV